MFVSMTSENLVSYASQYHIQGHSVRSAHRTAPSQNRSHHQPLSGSPGLPSFGGLRQISSRYYVDNSSPRTMAEYLHARAAPSSSSPMTPTHMRNLHVWNTDDNDEDDDDDEEDEGEDDEDEGGDEDEDDETPLASASLTVGAGDNSKSWSRISGVSYPPELQVFASYDEPSGDEEESSSRGAISDLHQQQLLLNQQRLLLDRQRRNRAEASSEVAGRSHRTRPSDSISIARKKSRKIEWAAKNSVGAENAEDSSMDGYSVPHAQFFIQRKKHVISIKFIPPV